MSSTSKSQGSTTTTTKLSTKAIEAKHHSNRTILSWLVGASIYGLGATLTAVIIPTVVSGSSNWIELFWPSIAVTLLWTIWRAIQTQRQKKEKAEWADDALALCAEYEELEKNVNILQCRIDEFDKNRESLRRKIKSIDNAVTVLTRSLRNQVAQKVSAGAQYSETSGSITCTMEVFPEQLYQDIHSLCNYISEVATIISDAPIRCGIIIKDPCRKNMYVPIAVYDPRNLKYKSPHKFKSGSAFSEYLINKYTEESRTPDHKAYARIVIPNIREHNEAGKNPPIKIYPGQERHLQSMAGSVIYFRPSSEETVILGAMNIDCSIPGTITPERFDEFSHYLRPAYRLIADKLFLISKDKKIYQSIYKLK